MRTYAKQPTSLPKTPKRDFHSLVTSCAEHLRACRVWWTDWRRPGTLDAALKLGHPCGGWSPKARLSQTGPIPEKYPVREWQTKGYPARTKKNVIDFNGTLIISRSRPTCGTALTVKLCKEIVKPCLVLDLNRPIDPEAVWLWSFENKVFTVNVAKPRESKNPGLQAHVAEVMGRILEYAKGAYPVTME